MKIRKFFEILMNYYGTQKWCLCQTGLRREIATRAILTPKTVRTDAEVASGNLLAADVMSPEKVLAIPYSV